MAFLKSLEQLRSIEWSSSHLWDIKFENVPSPFDSWFPATDISLNEFALDPYNFTLATSTFEVPKSSTLFDLKVTFVDDIKLTISEWVSNWVNNEIFADGSVQTLEEAVKQVTIVKMDNRHEIIHGWPKSFWVFPKGSLYFNGKSTAEPHSDELEFVIAGQL